MIQKDEILLAYKNADEEEKKVLLKLYTKYVNYKVKKFKRTEVNKINIKIAFDRIRNAIRNSRIQDSIKSNVGTFGIILEEYNNLDILVRHLTETFDDKKDEIVFSIIKLEVLLNIKVSFPQYLSRCIEEIIENTKGKHKRW